MARLQESDAQRPELESKSIEAAVLGLHAPGRVYEAVSFPGSPALMYNRRVFVLTYQEES